MQPALDLVMRADICPREDYETQHALLESFARIGAFADDDFDFGVPLPTGFLPFRMGTETFNVFVDAWGVYLEGSEDTVNRVLTALGTAE